MDAIRPETTAKTSAAEALSIARARWLLDRLHVIYLGGGATAAGLSIGLLFMAPSVAVVAWGGVALAYFLACRRLNAHARLHAIETVAQAKRWHRYTVAASVFQGLKWGAAAWLFLHLDNPAQALLVLGVLVSVVAGSMVVLISHPRCYALLSCLVMLPLTWRLLEAGSTHLALALLLIGSAAVGIYLVFNTHDSLIGRLSDDLAHKQLAADLEAALAHAQEQSKNREDLLTQAAHDLRTPVVALELMADDLLKSRGTAVGLEHKHRHFRDELRDLSLLLDSVLDLNVDGADEQPQANIELDRFLEATVARFNPLARGHNVRLLYLASRQAVIAPPAVLRRMIDNLLSNAIRHARGGRVVLAVRRYGQQLRLEVRDSGAGIAPVEHTAFKQRATGETQLGARMRQMGLGLAIVEQLAERAGIGLTRRSAPGRGTVMGLVLRRAESLRESPQEQADMKQQTA